MFNKNYIYNLILFIALIFVMISCLSNSPNQSTSNKNKSIEKSWSEATTQNTISGYELFILKYPGSSYVNDAINKLDDVKWTEAINSNSLYEYLDYIYKCNNKNHIKEAVKQVQNILVRFSFLNENEIDNFVIIFNKAIAPFTINKIKDYVDQELQKEASIIGGFSDRSLNVNNELYTLTISNIVCIPKTDGTQLSLQLVKANTLNEQILFTALYPSKYSSNRIGFNFIRFNHNDINFTYLFFDEKWYNITNL